VPTFVHVDKCDGCRALDRPACMYICPHDLMALDVTIAKGYNQEPDLCWECYACVKVCPQGAIEMRGYADVMPMGSRVTPLRGTDSIMWAIQFRDGNIKRFKYPIRTTAWGSINPEVELPVDPGQASTTQLLAGEPKYLLVDSLPGLPTD
jgi:adenylylsulfate reductase, subunit B